MYDANDVDLDPMPLVLMYHSVVWYDTDPYHVTVRPDRFAAQMAWLDRRGIRGTSVRELLDGASPDGSPPRVGLTFDDGYADFVTDVLPILERHGFTATVFVVAGRLGGHNAWDRPGPRKRLMTAAQVRQAADAGMEVGSHGLRHVRLTSTPDQDLHDEVERSRSILEDLIGQRVRGFGYPYDDVAEREVDAVQAAGYEYGCAVSRSEVTGRYALPRTYIGDRDGDLRLLAKWTRHRLTWGSGVR